MDTSAFGSAMPDTRTENQYHACLIILLALPLRTFATFAVKIRD